mmetsp:Transcript_6662/g.19898  ORF Transcript_6662/g.19898 Transcript_6662/m.19898 type:complete len:175 (+) Transcript_6662:369-893(+)
MSSDDASSFPIGASVSGTTASGDPFGGVVYSYDPRLHLCVLRAPGDIQNSHHVHVVRTKGAKVMHRVDATGDAARITEETLPAIDRGRQERRFEASVKAAQFVADNIGENVTEQAQEIFDALARTLPCRWNDQVIVVLDEISIAPPYTDPTGGDDGFRERIKNVLLHERRRLGM